MSITATTAIETINPANGQALARHEVQDPAHVDATLEGARDAYRAWRTTTFDERAAHVRRLAVHLRSNKHHIAKLATLEMGKPIAEAEAEVEKCAWNCDFFAEHAARFLADEPTATTASESYVAYRPLGVVLAIMPWNFPYWQVFRFAAPALMAGNVGVLKHAANVSECALEIERAFAACGFPKGSFSTLLVAGRDMDAIVADPRIAAVTLTGSEGAGSAVAGTAGKHLKKTVLELGGSDAFIVLPDADIEAAAQTAVKARFQNAGQSCIAAKRFIVDGAVYDAFVSAFVRHARDLRVGDPLDANTQVGPLAREDLREALHRQVQRSLEMGATIELGGSPLDRPGYYYAPTIVGNVTDAMPMFREETFGPAAAVVRARGVDHAVELANASDYGLGGNLWTRDIDGARRIAASLQSGSVFINGMTMSDPRLPFGGVKKSGYGRELAAFGIREFVNIQTVWIGPANVPGPALSSE